MIYCQANLTDGFIPQHAIESFGVRARNKATVAEELCRSLVPGKGPLWVRVDGGFQVHDYLDWNEARGTILAERASAKARMALIRDPHMRAALKVRDGDRCRYCAKVVSWQDRKGGLGATYDHVDPKAGDTVENLVICCRGCSGKKAARTPIEAGMVLLPPPGDQQQNLDADLDPDLIGSGESSSTHVPQPRVPSEPERSARPRRQGPAVGLLKPNGFGAFEHGRIFVPWQVHHKFEKLKESSVLMAFYAEVAKAWTDDGPHAKDETGADWFAFWTYRYNEKWPARKPSTATPEPPAPRDPTAKKRYGGYRW